MNMREVKWESLNQWLENEDEINSEYFEIEEALQEVNDVLHLDTEEDVQVFSKGLTHRGYKTLNKVKIKDAAIDTFLEELMDKYREETMIMDLYHELEYGSQVVVNEIVDIGKYGAFVYTTDELKKGDKRLRVINEYSLILNDEHKGKLEKMNEEEKRVYIIENGEYVS